MNTDLTDELEERRLKREAAMAALWPLDASGTETAYGLYTYEVVDGQEVCNLYVAGPQAQCQQVGQQMQAANPKLGFMVLPCQALPAPAA